MSTDWAHSLSDAFATPIGQQETRLADGLYGLEIDPVQESEAAWGSVQGYLQQLFTVGREVSIEAEELLVFPGLEELFALLRILDISESGRFDVLIVDCAPTGETLSLLKFPEMLGQFVRKMLPIKRKAVQVAGPAVSKLTHIPMPEESVFDEIERLTQRLEDLQAVMSDKSNVSLRIVTTTERIVIQEAKRNFTWLQLYDYNVDAVIVNRLYPDEALSGYFAHWADLQRRGLTELRESFADIPLFTMALKPRELKTLPELLLAAEELYGSCDPLPVLAQKTIFTVSRDGDDWLFAMALAFADKSRLELSQQGGELVIGVENTWRRILLPDKLQGLQVQSARLTDGVLKVRLH